MKARIYRLASLFLCLVMIFNIMPTIGFALDPGGVITSTKESSTSNEGVFLKKTASYDPTTQKTTLTLETYTTGEVVTQSATAPTDIVIVLDVSGSMDSTDMTSLKTAVNNFINATEAANQSASDKHSIAIVKFASASYYGGSSNLTPGNHTFVEDGNEYNYTEVVADFTTVDGGDADSLRTAVGNLQSGGATAVDYGLTLASNLLSARAAEANGAYADREKVVIVFTDGDPTHSSSYSEQVAYSAVNMAEVIKSAGAKIYTIGVFDDADPSGTDDSNIFMNYVSSNYPNAYGSTSTEYFLFFPYTVYDINPGAQPHYTDYYMAAHDANGLNSIFQQISDQIGRPTVELGESAVLIDVISDYFVIDRLSSLEADISVSTVDYLGGGNWSQTPDDDPVGVSADVTRGDTVTVTGFDFDENYISETARGNNFKGKKLILTITTSPNYERIDAAGAFAGGVIPTNDTAAILDSESNAVAYVESPGLTANTVTYKVDGVQTAQYYRFPNAEVSVLPTPANTAELSYSPWSVTGAVLNGGSFTMPSNDVVLESVSAANQYSVTFSYVGEVPANTTPASADLPQTQNYAVGSAVPVPSVNPPSGYAFSGWTEDGGDIQANGASFIMPAQNLYFEGHFTALQGSYKVEHYLMDANGYYPQTASHFEQFDDAVTDETVTITQAEAEAIKHTGYTFDSANTLNVMTGTVASDGSLTLKLYYKRNVYNVTYHYINDTAPAGTSPATSELSQYTKQNILYGATVNVNTLVPTTPAGYTFSGWSIRTGDTAIDANGNMVMPNSNVTLYGSFSADGDIPYTVEHYFEGLDGEYRQDPNIPAETHKGITDDTAIEMPLSGSEIYGFSYDPVKTAEKADADVTVVDGSVSGTIKGDGSLKLELYYSRVQHKVTYQYTGVPTDGTTYTPLPAEVTYKYQQPVQVAPIPTADNYRFVGWTTNDVAVTSNGFTMPAGDVVFTGHFEKIPASYTVNHYVEGINGQYALDSVTPSDEFTVNVHQGDTVTGVPRHYNTFTYDSSVTSTYLPQGQTMTQVGGVSVPSATVAAGTNTINLYYTRNTYTITYQIDGDIPEGIDTPAATPAKHGTTVNLASFIIPAGYTFTGWLEGTATVSTPYVMPARNVTLKGTFAARTDVPYAVKYHLENVNGGYTESSDSFADIGTTGEYVSAPTKTYYGYTFNSELSNWNGHITGDGMLILNCYYDLNEYTVSYYYFGTPPAPTDAAVIQNGNPLNLTDPYLISTADYKYGQTVTVDAGLTSDNANYEFKGWYSANIPGTSYDAELPAGTTFTMPAHNVEFRGALYDYLVFYNLDGGTLDGSETVPEKHVNWDDADLLPAGTPVKANKIFTGWKYENNPAYITASDKFSDLAVLPDIVSVTLVADYADGYVVSYNWGTANVPPNVALPRDNNTYADGDNYTVDTFFTEGYTVEQKDMLGNVISKYIFSGWNDPGNGTINGQNVTVTGSWRQENVRKPPIIIFYEGSVELTKVDEADATILLPNASYDMYRIAGAGSEYVGSYTTDAAGKIFVTSLPIGNYYFVETKAPEGYVLDGTRINFAITMAKTTYLTATNKKASVPSVFADDHYAYIIGFEDGMVHPEANITRAQVATIFFRLLDDSVREQYMTKKNSFPDVQEGMWFNTAVSTMAAMGVVVGYPDGTFNPEGSITRAEFAAIAARFEANGNSSPSSFDDIYEHWAYKELNIAANNGWVLGYEDGTFRPDQLITRAEAVTMVNRVLQRIPESASDLLPNMIVWPDNMDKDEWYYLMIQEATNSHYYVRKDSGYEYWTELRPVRDWASLEK